MMITPQTNNKFYLLFFSFSSPEKQTSFNTSTGGCTTNISVAHSFTYKMSALWTTVIRQPESIITENCEQEIHAPSKK